MFVRVCGLSSFFRSRQFFFFRFVIPLRTAGPLQESRYQVIKCRGTAKLANGSRTLVLWERLQNVFVCCTIYDPSKGGRAVSTAPHTASCDRYAWADGPLLQSLIILGVPAGGCSIITHC